MGNVEFGLLVIISFLAGMNLGVMVDRCIDDFRKSKKLKSKRIIELRKLKKEIQKLKSENAEIRLGRKCQR